MYYKTFSKRLSACGWEITDEAHGGDFYPHYPHYFRYEHPSGSQTIELVCASNKDGTPGRILKAWQDGKPARV